MKDPAEKTEKAEKKIQFAFDVERLRQSFVRLPTVFTKATVNIGEKRLSKKQNVRNIETQKSVGSGSDQKIYFQIFHSWGIYVSIPP
jgi:hypothetical protein